MQSLLASPVKVLMPTFHPLRFAGSAKSAAIQQCFSLTINQQTTLSAIINQRNEHMFMAIPEHWCRHNIGNCITVILKVRCPPSSATYKHNWQSSSPDSNDVLHALNCFPKRVTQLVKSSSQTRTSVSSSHSCLQYLIKAKDFNVHC
jgi:hypothetical protein